MFILAVLWAGLAFAQGPDKPQQIQAVEKRDNAVAVARKSYLKAVMQAERQCVQELSAAIANAGKNGNSDAVTVLAEAKKAAEGRFEQAKAEAEGGLPEGRYAVKYDNGGVSSYVVIGGKVSYGGNFAKMEISHKVIWLVFSGGECERLTPTTGGWKVDHFPSRPSSSDQESNVTGFMSAE